MDGKYYLLDLERTIPTSITHYWKPNKLGYTNYIDYAGIYTYEQAKEIIESDFDKTTIMIDAGVAQREKMR